MSPSLYALTFVMPMSSPKMTRTFGPPCSAHAEQDRVSAATITELTRDQGFCTGGSSRARSYLPQRVACPREREVIAAHARPVEAAYERARAHDAFLARQF